MTKPTRYHRAPSSQPQHHEAAATPAAVETDKTRQQQILATIRRLTREQGMPPTLREVGRILGIDSTGYLTWLRDDLVRRALLTVDARSHRSMRLTPAGHLALREAEQRERLSARGGLLRRPGDGNTDERRRANG